MHSPRTRFLPTSPARALLVAAGVACLGPLAGTAQADAIIFTFAGTASGTLDGVGFTDQTFVLTATADTDTIATFSDGVFYITDSTTIELLGSTLQVASTTSVNFNTTNAVATLGNDDVQFDALLVFSGAFGSYDGISSLADLTDDGFRSSAAPLTTDLGVLRFTDADGPLSFSATLAPTPGAGVLIAGALLLAPRRRRPA